MSESMSCMELCISCIGVTLPKQVFIQNVRLGICDIFLKTVAIGIVAYTAYNNEGSYTTSHPPDFSMNVWTDEGDFAAASTADMLSDMCDTSRNNNYDYWYDANGTWDYSNISCTELSSRERAVKFPTSLFVPTYMSETFTTSKRADEGSGGVCDNKRCWGLGKCPVSGKNWTADAPNSQGQCLCKCSDTRNLFATGSEKIAIGFQHWPQYPHDLLELMEARGESQPKSRKDANIVTIVRDSNHKEVKRFAPDEDITLDVGLLLDLGGKDGGVGYSLDDHHHAAFTRNHLLDKVALAFQYKASLVEYPHLRITGSRVVVHVNYYNGMSRSHESDDLSPDPVCYLDVEVTPQWVSLPIVDYLEANEESEGVQRMRYYQGLRVSFIVGGSYTFFDPVKILVYIASSLVIMMMPQKIMAFFSKFCLGTLSDIYYAAQTNTLNYWDLFSGEVVRALVGMFTYNKLLEGQNKKKADDGLEADDECLEWDTLKEQIIDLFEEHDSLDADEMDTLLCVLFKLLDRDSNKTVTQQAFVEAFVNTDCATLTNWADLFDLDRSRCFLERMFDTNAKARKAFASHSEGQYRAMKINSEELEKRRGDKQAKVKKQTRAARLAAKQAAGNLTVAQVDLAPAHEPTEGALQMNAIMDEIHGINPATASAEV